VLKNIKRASKNLQRNNYFIYNNMQKIINKTAL